MFSKQLTIVVNMSKEQSLKNKHATFPFLWSGWDEQDTDTFTFYNCEVLEDFGVIKAGDYTSITDNGMLGVLDAVKDNDFENPLSQKYKAQPIIE